MGCTLGIVPHLLATVLGLAAVMHTSAVAVQILKYAGVAYLLCLAVATRRDRTGPNRLLEQVTRGSFTSRSLGTLERLLARHAF